MARGVLRRHKFLTPAELSSHLRRAGLTVRDINGLVLDPLALPVLAHWKLSLTDTDVNYIVCATMITLCCKAQCDAVVHVGNFERQVDREETAARTRRFELQ